MFMTSWALLYTFAQKKSNLKCMSIKYWRFFVWTCQRKCFTLDLFYMWRKFHLKGRRCWKMQSTPTSKKALCTFEFGNFLIFLNEMQSFHHIATLKLNWRNNSNPWVMMIIITCLSLSLSILWSHFLEF